MAETVVSEVKALARHLPALGGAMGMVVLCAASIGMADHVVRELLSNGGDVTALVARLTAISAKAAAWSAEVLTFLRVW